MDVVYLVPCSAGDKNFDKGSIYIPIQINGREGMPLVVQRFRVLKSIGPSGNAYFFKQYRADRR